MGFLCLSRRYFRKWKAMDVATNSFVFVILLNYIALFGLALKPFIESLVSSKPTDFYVVTRVLILLTIIVFQCVHAWFGLFHDNIYELYATFVTQLAITVTVIFRVVFLPEWTYYDIGLLCYALIAQLAYILYIQPLTQEYSWIFYKKAGADPVFRSKYRKYLKLHVMLKFDLMVVIINTLVYGGDGFEWQITYLCVNIAVGLLHFNIGRIAFRDESIPFLVTFCCLSLSAPVYVTYGFTQISRNFGGLGNLISIRKVDINQPYENNTALALMFLVSGTLIYILRLLLVYFVVVVYRHWGEGVNSVSLLYERKRTHDDLYGMDGNGSDPTEDYVKEHLSYDDVISNTKYVNE